ncbi:MAG: PQQ-binding-like beta-propeller repeat protein [Acidimicrobiales bacterium]
MRTPRRPRPSWSSCLATAAVTLAMAGCESGGGSGPVESPAPALTTAWRWVAPPPSYVGMPGADDAGVAVTFGRSHLVLFDAAGEPRWTVDRRGLRDVAPRLTSDSVLVATEDGLAAFDREAGGERWATEVGERANVPVLAAGRAVASTWEGSLVGFDPATGLVAWRTGLPGPALGPAAAAPGDTVVVSWEADHGASAGVVAVDASTGRQRWSAPVPPGGVSAPGVVAPTAGGPPLVVVVAGDGAAHGLASESGAEQWRADLDAAGSPENAPLDAGGGAALVAHRLGGMALLDGADGSVRWQVASDGAAERGGPAGPGPRGLFALPLEDGRLLLAGPDLPTATVDPPGRVSGVAMGPGGTLVTGVREAVDNDLTTSTGW